MTSYCGKYEDDLVLHDPSTVSGKVDGDLLVLASSRISGSVDGDVMCRADTKISGRVGGDVIADDCTVHLSGHVAGDARAINGGTILGSGHVAGSRDEPAPKVDAERKAARKRLRKLAAKEGLIPKAAGHFASLHEKLSANQQGGADESNAPATSVQVNGHMIDVTGGALVIDGRVVEASPGRDQGASTFSNGKQSRVSIGGYSIVLQPGAIIVNGNQI